jgi:hypothetical protein
MTTITNAFTNYFATIRKSNPSIATLSRHIRKSKASDCQSVTIIEIDGQICELIDLGNGLELVAR